MLEVALEMLSVCVGASFPQRGLDRLSLGCLENLERAHVDDVLAPALEPQSRLVEDNDERVLSPLDEPMDVHDKLGELVWVGLGDEPDGVVDALR